MLFRSPWCSRLAACHLRRMIASGEDIEKGLVTASAAELAEHAAEIQRAEEQEIRRCAGAAR